LTDLEHDAKKYSFKLLGYRGRSENELRERLHKKGFPENIISSTLTYLKHAGYLDDRNLAVHLKKQAFKDRLLGYNGAKRFMMKRGLPVEVIESTIEYNENSELQNAKKLLEKKLKTTVNYLSINEKRRLWNFLARRGYSLSTTKKALKTIVLNDKH
jgi:regulatory protein